MEKHYDDPWFWECVRAAMSNPRFVNNWMRLHEVELPRTAIEKAVDEASGHNDWLAQQFLDDVKELIYDRV